jgi:hypothetical protein
MDRDLMSCGRVYRAAVGFNKLYHLSGIPREFWAVQRNDVSFQSYRARREWKSDPDIFVFKREEQEKFFDDFVATAQGNSDANYDDYAGMTVAVTSTPTDNMAQAIAAHAATKLLDTSDRAIVRWLNANQRDKWNHPVKPDWDSIPDLVVISGLMTDPSKDLKESVVRLHDWAIKFAPCFLVGSGKDPLDLTVNHYGIMPNVALHGFGVSAARVRTFG